MSGADKPLKWPPDWFVPEITNHIESNDPDYRSSIMTISVAAVVQDYLDENMESSDRKSKLESNLENIINTSHQKKEETVKEELKITLRDIGPGLFRNFRREITGKHIERHLKKVLSDEGLGENFSELEVKAIAEKILDTLGAAADDQQSKTD